MQQLDTHISIMYTACQEIPLCRVCRHAHKVAHMLVEVKHMLIQPVRLMPALSMPLCLLQV